MGRFERETAVAGAERFGRDAAADFRSFLIGGSDSHLRDAFAIERTRDLGE